MVAHNTNPVLECNTVLELDVKNLRHYQFGMGLRQIREARGLSQAELAEAAGTSQPQIDRLEKGLRKLTKEWAVRLAPPLKTTAQDLLFSGEGSPDRLSAPLISWVSAGALVSPDVVLEARDAPRVYAPDLDPKGDWVALQVEGDSMDRISPPESIIFVNRKDRKLVSGGSYVITDTESGAATYKRFRAGPDRWEPVSTNLEHEAVFVKKGREPKIIGRVRKTVLTM